ncbi:hypothetical protein VNO80_30328 [Phaseolus coccineus]|uniref:PGG domain-containing protein n=1 Tax=Phaseolus coccineus TaxID=3886 RepID=A0AAN9LG93_PHACN
MLTQLNASNLGILVEPLDAEKAIKSYMEKVEKSEDHEHKVDIDLENEGNKAQIFVKHTSVRFVKIVARFAFKCLSLSGLGVIVQVVSAANSGQNQEESTIESAPKNEEKEIIFVTVAKAGIVDLLNELQNKLPMLNQQLNSAAKEEEKVSAFLTAARNGIEEIVLELQSKIPSAIHETTPKSENVLLVAVKNKQVNVTEMLRKNLEKEIFDSLILEMDDRENTVLHLAAAGTSINERIWQRAGTTMQMIRDIHWYEYIRGLVPEEFNYRRNKDGETAWEIYERKHMQKVKDCSEALKDLSNSASVVAALIAGVSFATSGSLPGSTKDGKPVYSDQPAFDVFSIAALFGLGFSLTALVMFLAILTSSKKAQDFRLSLPLKLIFGLGSLFASVASMLLSFWAAYFFVLSEKYKIILFPVCSATCLPLTIYAVMQFPFYVELVRVISSKVPLPYRTHHPFVGPTSR